MAGALVLAGCGGGQNQETGGEEPAGEASVAPVTSQDINPKDRADLTQGGEVRLPISDFGTWNTGSVNANNDEILKAELPTLPLWFNVDAKGVASPNPDYLVSATEVQKSPTIINYKMNPKAVWGDGSPIDIDDMIASWKACNGENKKFQCATTQGYDSVESIKQGADKFDAIVRFARTAGGETAPRVV